MAETKDDTTYERISELLRYEPESGRFYWRKDRGKASMGDEAGVIDTDTGNAPDYIRIGVDYKLRLAHRLAYLLMTGYWPPEQIDHLDGDGTNNCWENIRAVSDIGNKRNYRLQANNSSGFRGIYWNKKACKWHVQIKNNGHAYHRGMFTNLDDAIQARLDAEIELWGCHPDNQNA